jgi:hypothetical protein
MALFDQNDAGGISASSRWLRSVSDDTTGRSRDIRSCTPAGVPAAFFLDLMTGGVASLNHRLLALMPPASFCYGMSLF